MTSSPARSCFASMPRNCMGTIFPAPGLTYNRICGRAIGYSTGSSDAFAEIHDFRNSLSIDEPYVDGISVTHGSPRQHIWCFAAGHGAYYRCPCDNPNHALNQAPYPPSYVGNNYFLQWCIVGCYEPPQTAAPSTIFHGSVCPSLPPPLMILK